MRISFGQAFLLRTKDSSQFKNLEEAISKREKGHLAIASSDESSNELLVLPKAEAEAYQAIRRILPNKLLFKEIVSQYEKTALMLDLTA